MKVLPDFFLQIMPLSGNTLPYKAFVYGDSIHVQIFLGCKAEIGIIRIGQISSLEFSMAKSISKYLTLYGSLWKL